MIPVKDVDGSSTSRRQGGNTSSNLSSMIIFVFGSNRAGRHGRGAAKFAVKHHGAKYGQGVGLQGNAYAIPTKDENLRVLPLDKIQPYIEEFIQFAVAHREMTFNVTKIGCGLAGYTPAQIGPMFVNALHSHNLFNSQDMCVNVNLPIEFGGTRDVFTDKDGEEVASADASATGSSTDPNIKGMVIKNNNTTTTDEPVVEIYHAGWTDADGVGATTPTIESMETVCYKCGFCGPQGDGYCQNQVTGPHVSQWGKRLKTMHMNDDLVYGDGDKVFVKLDMVSGMSSRERQLESKLHNNERGDLIQGLNLGEKKFRAQATKAEIAKAENDHIHKFGCACVMCTIGGIVLFDENGDPTGATANQPLGMGDSFVESRHNIFQKSVSDTFDELKKYINSNGIKGINPEIADYMMRIENRHMIANATIEYAPYTEWLQVQSSKPYSHNGGFTTKSKVPQKKLDNVEHWIGKCDVPWCSEIHETPVYSNTKKSAVDTPSCAPYHKMGWKIDTCSCNPRKQPTVFYMNPAGGTVTEIDEDGIKTVTPYHPKFTDEPVPRNTITLLRTTFGETTEYKPERETYEHYSYVIPTLLSFVTGDNRLRTPYPPAGTKEQIEAGDPRLVGTVKAPCKCIRNKKKMQCDCEYEDLEITKGDWNSTHVMSSDPVKGKSASLGDLERKKVWYHKWYNQGKEPRVQKFGFNICPEDKCSHTKDEIEAGATHQHWYCKKWYSVKNPLGPNYPKETTPWQKTFCKEKGVILPDNYTYDQSYKIVQSLFKDKIDSAKETIALQASLVEHQKQHTMPFPAFEICNECNAIYTHQDEAPDGEKPWEIAPAEDRIHMITDFVPYQEPIKVYETAIQMNTVRPCFAKQPCQYPLEMATRRCHHGFDMQIERWVMPKNEDFVSAVKFDTTGRYIRRTDIELAIVGSSKVMDWQVQKMTDIIRNTITSAKEAVGVERLVVSSGGADGVDTMAEQIAKELGVRRHIYAPDVQGWDDGDWSRELQRFEIGYKTRNINIARHCCKIINLVGKAPKKPKIARMCKDCQTVSRFTAGSKDDKCYKCKSSNLSKGRTTKVMCKHCNKPHYTSGGCFTANKAFWFGKSSETIEV